MTTPWMIALGAGVVVVTALMALLAWRLQPGPPIASTVVQAGVPFLLPVPASSRRRALWIRYRVTLTVPPARGPSVSPGSFYGITLRLEVAGAPRVLARGGLAPPEAEHFGLVDYQYAFLGSAGSQTLATTVKVIDVPDGGATTVSGTVEVAPQNQLLEATVWITG